MMILAMLLQGATAENTLPAYTYTGSDPIEAAVAAYTASLGEGYLKEEGCVTIPAPLIFRVDSPDADHALVYGNFWVFNYTLEDGVLKTLSGGEQPAILTLAKNEDGWAVIEAEQAGDGEDYKADIERFCQGDEELLAQFFERDADAVRAQYIRDYAAANGLEISAYQDYGWDPVPLSRDVTALLTGRDFEFCSGAGAWNTVIIFEENGTFTGQFHDSEMGEDGEVYPYGTVYGCLFHGQLGDAEQLDELTWKLTVLSLELDEGQVPEAIEDGIRFVTAEPYGLREGDEVILYLPGTPIANLPEDFIFWTHILEIDPEAETMPYMSLWDEAAESGFVHIEWDVSEE